MDKNERSKLRGRYIFLKFFSGYFNLIKPEISSSNLLEGKICTKLNNIGRSPEKKRENSHATRTHRCCGAAASIWTDRAR